MTLYPQHLVQRNGEKNKRSKGTEEGASEATSPTGQRRTLGLGPGLSRPHAHLPSPHSAEAHPASALAREGVHQGLDPIVHEHGGVEQELLVAVLLGAHLEGVGHERVPVVELVELHGDAVAVLELGAEQQFRVKLQPQEVAAQLLHVLLNHNLDGLPWEGGLGHVSGTVSQGPGHCMFLHIRILRNSFSPALPVTSYSTKSQGRNRPTFRNRMKTGYLVRKRNWCFQPISSETN